MRIDLIKNIIKQVICWILLLQTINICINPPDLKAVTYNTVANKQQPPIDETESIYEWVVESMYDEEIPESDEDEIDTSSPSIELYFFNRACSILPAIKFHIEHSSYYYNNFPIIYQEPHSPPPKMA